MSVCVRACERERNHTQSRRGCENTYCNICVYPIKKSKYKCLFVCSYPQRAYSKDKYIQKICIFKRCVYSRDTYIQEICIFKRYVYSKDKYIQKISIFTFSSILWCRRMYFTHIYIYTYIYI